MTQSDESSSGYAVMLSWTDESWTWSVYGLDGRSLAKGKDSEREGAWRSGLLAAGVIGALERVSNRRF